MDSRSSAPISLSDLPEGTVTFLFTDIEGSTQLLHQLREQYTALLADQRKILRKAFANWQGIEVDTQGDSFFVAFSRATQAVGAAVEAQRMLWENPWPEDVCVRVRMGIHTGEPWNAEEGYVGMDVHRAARIAHVGHGGQVLLSETTTALVKDELLPGVSLLDLGRHLLKDINRPEHICQLVIDGLLDRFPPLKSLQELPAVDSRLPRQVGKCPYLGLSAFQEADAPFYFGRETFIAALEHAIHTKKLVAVIVGSSGSGKSSALFAGLLPRLRKEGSYLYAIFRPGSQPFYSLAGALLPLLESNLSEIDMLSETRKLAECLVKREVSLANVIERILEKNSGVRQVLLVADQFEELYTLCLDPALQKAFVDELLALVEAAKTRQCAPAIILVTLRADFMGQALAHRPFADALQEASMLMGPMTRQELRVAMEKPAEMQGAAFEPGLVERILDDVGEKPGNLPLLEFALTQLWEQQTDGWLTHANYEAMDCVEGALATYADQVYGDLKEGEQEQAQRTLVQLVQPGEGTEDTRRIAIREELGEESWSLVQRLADRRLVVTGRDALGRETAEVVHEALIHKWWRFQEWMDTDRAFRAWQERLRANLRQWQESRKDEGALLAGAPLAVAQSWLGERRDELRPSEVDYIEASAGLQVRRQKESQRRRQLSFIGLTTGLVIAIVLAAFALYQRHNSLRQASIGLAAQAQQELEGASPERSVLVALEALENYPYTWQAEQALGQIVREFRLRHILTGHTDTVLDAAWSPDGTQIATTGEDGTVRIWDAQTYTESRAFSAHRATVAWAMGVRELAWSPQGDRLATAAIEGTAKVWDAASGEEIALFSGHADEVWGVTWSPDGAWVASASKDATVKVWNALTGEESLTLSGHTAGVKSAAWSPDGKSIATAGDDNTTRVWDAVNGEERFELSGHTNMVWSVAWSPDGTRLATASEDGTIRVWDADTGTQLSDIRLASPVWQAAWSPDGKQLATTSSDGQAHVWDVSTGTEAFSLQGRSTEQFGIAWSPDGKSLATTGGAGFSVCFWDASPGALTISQNQGAISWASWSPDGNRVATVNYLDVTLVVWDSHTGEALLTINTGASPGNLQDVFWSPDGTRLYTTDWDMMAKVWDANTGQLLLTFAGHVGEPKSKFQEGDSLFGGGWSPDSSKITTAGGWGRTRVWDARTGEEYVSFQATNDYGVAGRWSPDGKRLATCAMPQVIQIWDAATGNPILGGYVNNTKDLSFGDSMDMCFGPEWSPDGRRLLTTSYSGNGATIWDARTGESILVFKEHTGALLFPTWSPNGERVATGDSSGLVNIWDSDTGAVLLSYSIPVADWLFQLAWSPDGTQLIGVGMMPSAEIHRVWQSAEDLVAYAKECCVIRELTQEERDQFGLR